jgi:signal transduction histidine kinase
MTVLVSGHTGAMREGARARTRGWRQGVIRREWLWLGASGLVAAVIVGLLLVFHAYETGYRSAAANALAAELAASQVNALEWQTIAEGRVPPGRSVRAGRLLAVAKEHLDMLGAQGDAPSGALARYALAIRTEFEMVAMGRIAAARSLDSSLVDPAFRDLSTSLRKVARDNAVAADRANVLATAGDVAAAAFGLAIVAILLLRFTAAQRALAAADVEERLLRETDRAKNNLISVVSHDLRTPLTSIVGYLEILDDEESGPLNGGQRRAVGVMRRNAGRLIAIVNDLLFVARAEEGRIELTMAELSLERVAADAIEDQRLEAQEEGVDLRLAARPAPPVLADRHRVDLLIENLLSNALKFTPAGGSVRLGVAPVDGHVRLEVSDTGIGISAEYQKHLFERFFRTPETVGTPGVGLGLSIVKAIADAHHATVRVHSEPGQGTTFQVDFPHAPERRLSEPDPASPPAAHR